MSGNFERGRYYTEPVNGYDYRSNYRRDTRGPRRDDRGDRRYMDEGRSRYGGGAPRNVEKSRYQNGGRYRQDMRQGNARRQDDVNWDLVVPISQRKRLRPTQWDVSPKGFEKVPAERAKLSGLFPLPGQPQDLDQSKLEGIVSSGVLTRRTRILFEDPTKSNMSKTKFNQMLILTGVGSSVTIMENAASYIKDFVKLIDEAHELISHKLLQENRLVLRFGSEETTTIVLACQKFIEKKTQCKYIWQRPGEGVQRMESEDPICGGSVVALQELQEASEEELKSNLEKAGVEVKWLKLITLSGSQEATGAALLEPKNWKNDIAHYRWIRPNEFKLRQTFSEISFQQLPQLVAKRDHSVSKVIVLLNCVDPMDLKNEEFVREIHDAMINSTTMTSLGQIESVKIPKPGADYRTSFETVEESVGKIFVKFKELEGAEAAMRKLASGHIL